MASAGVESASFDLETVRTATDKRSAYEVNMYIDITASAVGEPAVNGRGQCTVKKPRAVHIQEIKIRQENEHLGEDIKEARSNKNRISYLPIVPQVKEGFLGYSRSAFPLDLAPRSCSNVKINEARPETEQRAFNHIVLTCNDMLA